MKITVQRLPANSAKHTTTLTKMTWRNSFVTNLNTPFMIGDVEIPNRTVLAPMAGVTNSAFRTIAKELGAEQDFELAKSRLLTLFQQAFR